MTTTRSVRFSGRAASCVGVVESGDFVRPTKAGVYVKLRVWPGAKRTEVKGLYGEEVLKLSGAAPPTEGKANAEIERYLSSLFGVPRSGIAVVKGASSRDKLVLVRGAEVGAVREGLGSVAARGGTPAGAGSL